MTDNYMEKNITDIELDFRRRLKEALNNKQIAQKRLYLALLFILIASIIVVLCFIVIGLSGEKGVGPSVIVSMLTNGLCFIIANRIWSLGKNKPGGSFQWSWLWFVLGFVNGIIIVIGLIIMLLVFIRGKITITNNYEKAVAATYEHASMEKQILKDKDEETERIRLAKNEIIAMIEKAIGNDKILQESKVSASPTVIEDGGIKARGLVEINKTSARGSDNIPFTICPYCSKELTMHNTLNFCPYCGERIMT